MSDGGPALVERREEVAGVMTFIRERPGAGPPAVFFHGNPTNSSQWLPFVDRLSGPAVAPDLPCFGRSSRPAAEEFDATLESYADWVEAFFEQQVSGSFRLVVQDWGAIALAAAARMPQRVDRLLVINSVPLSADYRWHWIGRLWRRRVVGELFNRAMTRTGVRQLLRIARADRRPMPAPFIDEIWEHLDRDTRDAILRLYRSADPARLAAAGEGLGRIGAPALVIWGQRDPFIGGRFGRAYADRLGGADLFELERAGHWPWLEDESVIERSIAFLEDGRP